MMSFRMLKTKPLLYWSVFSRISLALVLSAVHHVSATIAQGELLAIVGPNGAGKSTLLNAMARPATIHEGSIEGKSHFGWFGRRSYCSRTRRLGRT